MGAKKTGGAKAKRAAKAEHEATREAARYRNRPVVKALGAASEVADQPPLIALSVVTIIGGAVFRRPAMIRAGARMLSSHLIATGIKTMLKNGIDRTRPARALADGEHRLSKGSGGSDGDIKSFPSGHTAGAVAIAQALSRDVPGAAIPARVTAGVIGAMQLPRGTHYASDVAVGAAIGWLSERIASGVLAAIERRVTRLQPVEQRVALQQAEMHPNWI